jgi:hypothetical protein
MTRRDWIVAHVGEPLFEALSAGLAGSELQSVLLEVMQRRATARAPSELLAQYRRDPFSCPAPIDLRESVALDAHLLAAAQAFDAIELSPVAPLGVCSTLALTDQNRVLSALRSTEVVSDPTNVLALECAARLTAQPDEPVHLATSQRVLRAQPVPKLPGYTQHFRLFALTSGGREARDHAFTVETVLSHLRTLLAALDRLELHGYAFGARRVHLLANPARAAIADRIAEQLGAARELPIVRQPLDHAYYSGGIRYQIWVTAPDGVEMPLIDGGTFDWLATLTSNRRLVYVASGVGAQLIALRFRVATNR